jgi:RHS repeat-associated protein
MKNDIGHRGIDRGLSKLGKGDIVYTFGQMRYLTGNGNTEDGLFFYHGNHLSSTQMITDINAKVVQQVLYAPFGEVITEYNAYWHNGLVPDYMFNAKELDEESGMYYYEARYYAPPSFISRDPLFEKYPFISPYAYCANNPVIYSDPTGMEAEPPDFYLNLETGRVEHHEGSENLFDQGLVHLAGDDATMGDVENELSKRNYNYQKDASVPGGYRVDTEKQYKAWKMMEWGEAYPYLFGGEALAGVLGLFSKSTFVARYAKGKPAPFSQSNANSLVTKLKEQYGGNVTVMKDGKPVFRVHQPGTHGQENATMTKFRQGVNPHNGQTFNISDKKVSPFDQKAYETLNKAINNEGGYTITTKGGR